MDQQVIVASTQYHLRYGRYLVDACMHAPSLLMCSNHLKYSNRCCPVVRTMILHFDESRAEQIETSIFSVRFQPHQYQDVLSLLFLVSELLHIELEEKSGISGEEGRRER